MILIIRCDHCEEIINEGIFTKIEGSPIPDIPFYFCNDDCAGEYDINQPVELAPAEWIHGRVVLD